MEQWYISSEGVQYSTSCGVPCMGCNIELPMGYPWHALVVGVFINAQVNFCLVVKSLRANNLWAGTECEGKQKVRQIDY